jgi:hypothetical protein
MKKILLILLLAAPGANAQRLSALIQTNVVVGTNTLPVVVYPNAASGTRQISVANLFSNRALVGWATFDGPVTNAGNAILNTNGLTLRGTNQISAPASLGEMGAHLWSDGTNLCVVLQNKSGGRSTNKLSMTAWP